MKTPKPRYWIETEYSDNWERNVGEQGNGFRSRAEAEMAIRQLRQLGEEWATAKYRVVEEVRREAR